MNGIKHTPNGVAANAGNSGNGLQPGEEVRRMQETLDGITASLSWRLTAPLRALALKIRIFRNWLYRSAPEKTNTKITGVTGVIAISAKNAEPVEASQKIVEPEEIVFGETDTPLVSIIIPVYNNLPDTLACLHSVSEHMEDIPCEVILADDASESEMEEVFSKIKNLRIIRQEANRGFLHNCNDAAAKAKGRFLHFLNNDTRVTKGWLSALLETIQRSDTIGMTGSKLLFFDGKLQEAGGMIWCKATGLNYGRGDDPAKPEYNYVKEVDYISGASVLVRKTVWDELGGFDTSFSPAYFEDTDLAFRMRQKDYKVVYQPASIVYHKECGTYGEVPDGHTQILLEMNREKFRNRWETVLQEEKGKSDYNVFLHRERLADFRKVLFITHSVPCDDNNSSLHGLPALLNVLNQIGYRIKLIPDDFFASPATKHYQQAGIEILYGDDNFRNISQWLDGNLGYFDVVIFETPYLLRKYENFLTTEAQPLKICLAGSNFPETAPAIYKISQLSPMDLSCRIWAFSGKDVEHAASEVLQKRVDVVFPEAVRAHLPICLNIISDRLYALNGYACSPEALHALGIHFSALLQHG
jgi:GT2 family glycosyltransferase